MQEEAEYQMDTVEAYKLLNRMYEESENVKLIKGEYQDTRFLPLSEERGMKYTELQQSHCMNNRVKSSFCLVNSPKACISTELTSLIYSKVEKNQEPRIENIKQELCKPEKKEQQIELGEEEEKNPYEILLKRYIEDEVKPGHMQMEKWSIFVKKSNIYNVINTFFVIMN